MTNQGAASSAATSWMAMTFGVAEPRRGPGLPEEALALAALARGFLRVFTATGPVEAGVAREVDDARAARPQLAEHRR